MSKSRRRKSIYAGRQPAVDSRGPKDYILPVSHNSLPKRPGVPTAAAIFVLFRYATCSSSLKCFANNFATSPPFSPRRRLSLSTLVTSATRRAAPATKSSVGAPLFFGRWPMRVRSVGTTEEELMGSRRRRDETLRTLGNEVRQLAQIPRALPCARVHYGTLYLCGQH